MLLSVRGHARRLALRLAAVGLVAVAAVALAPGRSAARAATPAGTVYYVAIGASEALGFQGGPYGPTTPTDQGYTSDLVSLERARWPGLGLALFACAGLRVEMALAGGRSTSLPPSFQQVASGATTGRCRRRGGSEVGTASSFIRSHPGHVVLVTLDLGYPDVAACLAGEAVDDACVTDALARVRAGLPMVVARLRSAGGRSLEIVGLEHEDPLLAYYLLGSSPDPAFAEASAVVTEQFNRVVNAAYASVGVRVAHVGAAFATGDVAQGYLEGWGPVPLDVKAICSLTWMCTDGNIHPNARGYLRIASAVAAAVAGGVERTSPAGRTRRGSP